MKKNSKSSLLGVLILLLGVVMGLILVDQTQIFKNKAKELDTKSYIVCHRTSNPAMPWEEVEVKSEDLADALNSGDIFGNCPTNLTK